MIQPADSAGGNGLNENGNSGILFRTAASTNDAGIYKTGQGTVIFAGANTYTGQTIVNQGQLVLDGAGSISGVENAVQQVNLPYTGVNTGNADAGNFTLTYNGQTTGPITISPYNTLLAGSTSSVSAANLTANAIRQALAAVPGIGGIANILVSPLTDYNYSIAFVGALAGSFQNIMSINNSGITTFAGGGLGNGSIAITNNGGPSVVTINSGASLVLDNNYTDATWNSTTGAVITTGIGTGTAVNNRIGNGATANILSTPTGTYGMNAAADDIGPAVTFNGSNLIVIGNATTSAVETLGVVSLSANANSSILSTYIGANTLLDLARH